MNQIKPIRVEQPDKWEFPLSKWFERLFTI